MTDPDFAPFLAAIEALATSLSAAGAPHMFIGGVAVAAHGHARPTVDVDATVWCPSLDATPVLNALWAGGFEPRGDDFEDLQAMARMLLLRHTASGVDADVSLAVLPFEEATIHRAVEVDFLGLRLRIASLGDLIVQKAAAFRNIDKADIEALVALHRDALDIEALLVAFAPLADALGVPERVSELRALLRG